MRADFLTFETVNVGRPTGQHVYIRPESVTGVLECDKEYCLICFEGSGGGYFVVGGARDVLAKLKEWT